MSILQRKVLPSLVLRLQFVGLEISGRSDVGIELCDEGR